MNNNAMFVLFYVSVISVALLSSIYTSSLNAWNHIVFTFPPETQKVAENGTATMEIWWRWFPEALEVMVKVNDDETNATFPTTYKNETLQNRLPDGLTFLFDSDNNGRFSDKNSEDMNDHGVAVVSNDQYWPGIGPAAIIDHCFVDNCSAPGFISSPQFFGDFPHIWKLENWTRTFTEEEGYTFSLSIPIELINVKPPTNILVNFYDGDCLVHYMLGEHTSFEESLKLSLLVAELRCA